MAQPVPDHNNGWREYIYLITGEDVSEDWSGYLPLYKAAIRGDWESAWEFLDVHPDAITARITKELKTVLHVAVGTGKAFHFVENLVARIPFENLAIMDANTETALVAAVVVGNTAAARLLVGENPALPYLMDRDGLVPLHKAAQYGHKDMILYLLQVTLHNVDRRPFAGKCGAKLLFHTIRAGFYDVALDLVDNHYTDLVQLPVTSGETPLGVLAGQPSAFPSDCSFSPWEQFIYDCVHTEFKELHIHPNGGDLENPTGSSQACRHIICGLFGSISCLLLLIHPTMLIVWEGIAVSYIKKMRDTKLKHQQALQLVKFLCEKTSSLESTKAWELLKEAYLLAAKNGIHEIVEQITESFPSALLFRDENDRGVFQLAVLHRRKNVFNLIHSMGEHKHKVAEIIDSCGNHILHMAGMLAPPERLYIYSGAALQMQRERQWFKEVEKLVRPALRNALNSESQSPQMVFTESHKDLVIEGEKWMKQTASSCTVVAALIATVVFAAAIKVPGRNNESGSPNFSGRTEFKIFAVSDAVSLFSSTTSVLIFLSILTSRYAEDDFLFSLPNRLMFGLMILFISMTSMMVTFGFTLYLVVDIKEFSLLYSLVGGTALIVTSMEFLRLQVELLIELLDSTYSFTGRDLSWRSFGSLHIQVELLQIFVESLVQLGRPIIQFARARLA